MFQILDEFWTLFLPLHRKLKVRDWIKERDSGDTSYLIILNYCVNTMYLCYRGAHANNFDIIILHLNNKDTARPFLLEWSEF